MLQNDIQNSLIIKYLEYSQIIVNSQFIVSHSKVSDKYNKIYI